MKTLLIITTLLLSISGYASEDPKLAYKLAQDGKAVLIDVREEDEIKEGMVKGAQWFPLSRLETAPKGWKEDFKKIVDGKSIFVYCRSGVRAEKAKNILSDSGIPSKNIGGWKTLKDILPTTK